MKTKSPTSKCVGLPLKPGGDSLGNSNTQPYRAGNENSWMGVPNRSSLGHCYYPQGGEGDSLLCQIRKKIQMREESSANPKTLGSCQTSSWVSLISTVLSLTPIGFLTARYLVCFKHHSGWAMLGSCAALSYKCWPYPPPDITSQDILNSYTLGL